MGFLIGDSADSDELLSSTVFCGGHGEAFLTARPPAPRSGFPTAGGCPRRAPGGGRPSVGSGCGCRAHGRHRAPGPDLELPQMPRALGPPAPASRPPTLQATPLTPVISTGHQHGAHCFAVISSGSRKIFSGHTCPLTKKKGGASWCEGLQVTQSGSDQSSQPERPASRTTRPTAPRPHGGGLPGQTPVPSVFKGRIGERVPPAGARERGRTS